MKVVLFVAASAAAAAHLSVTSLTDAQRAVLGEDLARWEQAFGATAVDLGLLPPSYTEDGLSGVDLVNDKLQRILDTKYRAGQAQLRNPDATFDWYNQFALLNEREFSSYVARSFRREDAAKDFLQAATIMNDPTPTLVNASRAIDWGVGKCNNGVRHQGKCGLCWAHSAVNSVESAHCLASGQLLKLSVQQITSCSTNGGNKGCDGGFEYHAITYASSTGLCLDSAWPDRAVTGSCDNQCAKQPLSIGQTIRTSGEGELVSVLNTQPASVAVEAGNPVWQTYKGGVVTACPGASIDHAVVAVGYDDESFKIKNSWGQYWGEKGYMRLRRGTGGGGVCHVVAEISYPKIVAKCTRMMENTDFAPGNDLGSVARPSASDCCNDCTLNPRCQAFVWYQGVCYLKDAAGQQVWAEGRRAGLPAARGCSAIEENVDYQGQDLASTSQARAEDCCGDCKTTPNCQVFVWFQGTCYLKSGGGTKVQLGGRRAGRVGPACTALQADTDYHGNDIGSTRRASPSECCSDCQAMPGCKLFVWGTGTCWLKSAAGPSSVVPAAVAGFIVG